MPHSWFRCSERTWIRVGLGKRYWGAGGRCQRQGFQRPLLVEVRTRLTPAGKDVRQDLGSLCLEFLPGLDLLGLISWARLTEEPAGRVDTAGPGVAHRGQSPHVQAHFPAVTWMRHAVHRLLGSSFAENRNAYCPQVYAHTWPDGSPTQNLPQEPETRTIPKRAVVA